MAFDIYQAVTDRILDMLEKGTVPWRLPFQKSGDGWPKNLASGKGYRGINVFLLAMTSWAKGYDSSFWMTYKQAAERGGNVRKGEKSSMVVFWKQYETTDRQTGEPTKVPVLRYYNVFNAAQCEGITPPDAPAEPAEPFVPLDEAEAITVHYVYPDGPRIHQGARAAYSPMTDTVEMPDARRFFGRESYYATLFHELAHSTGHGTRLKRELAAAPPPFGSADYSREELVAEMGSAFLCATAGISPPTIEQSAAYIAGWQKKLGEDKKLVIAAAGAGQRASDWILGLRDVSHGEAISTAEPDGPAG